MANWSDKRCMSTLKGKLDRCKRNPIKNNDFCKTHCEEHIYDEKFLQDKKLIHSDDDVVNKYLDLIVDNFCDELTKKQKYLDDNFIHGLIGLNDSWSEIPFMYWFKCDDTFWDIRSLVKILAMQLNQSELEKPFPIFPENPFTRKKFSIAELRSLNSRIELLKTFHRPPNTEELNVNIALSKFLTIPDKLLNSVRNERSQYSASIKIINRLSTSLRYKMINYKDSQGRYCGYWVKKTTQVSQFEKYYNEIVTATVMYNNLYVLLDTPMYRKIINTLNKLVPEEYVI
jgi:hypothetical protein